MTNFKGFGKPSRSKDDAGRDRSSPSKSPSLDKATIEALSLARQYYQLGQRTEAEKFYRQVLQKQPGQTEALHRLGIMAHQMGKSKQAITYLQKVLALTPDDASAYNSLGIVLIDQNELEEAVRHFQRAIELNPNHVNAHSNLGNVLRLQGRLPEAVEMLQKALTLNADFPQAHSNLGITLMEQDELEQAETHLRRAIALNPNYADAYYNLGLVLEKLQQSEEAITCHSNAIALNPDYLNAHIKLGDLYREQGRYSQAVAHFQSALTLDANNASAHAGLGTTLQKLGNWQTAEIHLQQAIKLAPTEAQFYCILGKFFWSRQDVGQAIISYQKAIDLKPNFIEAHMVLANTLLSLGELQTGFTEYEWRWAMLPPPTFIQPVWEGSNLNGQSILICTEGGYGDVIQFIRYASLIKLQGARVIIICNPLLKRLLETALGVDSVIADGEPLPEFQVHTFSMSLPRIMGTTLGTIPANVPYLAPPADVPLVLEPFANTTYKVGFVWTTGYKNAGSDSKLLQLNLGLQESQRTRSCPLSQFIPLFQIPGISFYSLQVGPNAAELAELEENYPVQDLSPQIQDFADTAALIDQLDLVISVDTAVVHLAGALGKPVWVVLPYAADWRWLLDRQDSPWYPTMRLFRQPAPGDWDGVFREVAIALQELWGNHSQGSR